METPNETQILLFPHHTHMIKKKKRKQNLKPPTLGVTLPPTFRLALTAAADRSSITSVGHVDEPSRAKGKGGIVPSTDRRGWRSSVHMPKNAKGGRGTAPRFWLGNSRNSSNTDGDRCSLRLLLNARRLIHADVIFDGRE